MTLSRTNFLSYFISAILSLLAFLPLSTPIVRAADPIWQTCPIGISLVAAPIEVKEWSTPVNVLVTVTRDHERTSYCGTDDTVSFTIVASVAGGRTVNLRSGDIVIPANKTGVGERTVKRDDANFNFQLLGLKETDKAVGLAVSANVKRRFGYGENNFSINGAAPASVKLNKNTTVPQPGPGGTGTGTGNTNGNSNGPSTGIPNNATNTNISATFGDLDEQIGTFENILEFDTLPELLAAILRILFALIGTVAVIIIIISGFRMVMASGNETELTKAKAAITWAIVGLIVSLMAFSIVAIIQRIIQG